MRYFLRIGFIIVTIMNSGIAQEKSDSTKVNDRGDDFEIILVTIGPGTDLTSWWGHTAVIVKDKRLNSSVFYNYGLFSFEQDNFLTNFAMGRLIFWVGAWNTQNALAHYLSLNRDIRFQVLNLSPADRLKMAKFLAENVRPENREYLYDHYLDNCSTRVRDLLDMILKGQFSSRYHQPGQMTFRQHTRRHTYHNILVDWVLMFLMSSTIDHPIEIWDDMFLPEELERAVSDFTYTDANGNAKCLVEKEYPYYRAKDRTPVPGEAAKHWPAGLVIGLISGIFALIFAHYYRKNNSVMIKIFGYYHILFGIVYGIPGFILFLMSSFTDHTVTYYNENLFLANSLTILLIPLGIGLIRNKHYAVTWLPRYWYLHTGFGIILIFLKLFSVFNQQNWLSVSLILPLTFIMSYAWYQISRSGDHR